MTTAIATTKTTTSPLIVLGQKYSIEPGKLVEVLRGTVIKPGRDGKPATNEELAAFCIVANQYDLNPFTREIYAFASSEKGVTAIVPIDGWCKIVNRHKGGDGHPDFNGCEFDEVDGADGKPDRITCRMHVKGREHPVCATERYAECKRGTGPWGQHPYRMLRHKAYIQAARYAFGLGGIHDEDEGRDIAGIKTVYEEREPVAMPVAKQVEAPAAQAQEHAQGAPGEPPAGTHTMTRAEAENIIKAAPKGLLSRSLKRHDLTSDNWPECNDALMCELAATVKEG